MANERTALISKRHKPKVEPVNPALETREWTPEPDLAAPTLLAGPRGPGQVIALQRVIGNQAVQRLLARHQGSAQPTIRRSVGHGIIQRERGGEGGGMAPGDKAEMLKSTGDLGAAGPDGATADTATAGSYGANPYGMNPDVIAAIAHSSGKTSTASSSASTDGATVDPAASSLSSSTPTGVATGSYGANPYGMNAEAIAAVTSPLGSTPTVSGTASTVDAPSETASGKAKTTSSYGSSGYGMTDANVDSIVAGLGAKPTASASANALPTPTSASSTPGTAPASGGESRKSYPAGSTGVGTYHSKERLTGDWESTKGKSLGGDPTKFSSAAIPLLAEYHGDAEKDAVSDTRGLKPVKWKEAAGRKVKYISDEAERASYELKLHVDNKFYWRGQVMDTSNFVRATGAGLNRTTAKSVIFVLTVDGKVYVADEGTEYRLGSEETTADQWRFNHSSLVGGGPIASAGEMRFENGVLTAISNKSGHYHPGLDSIVRMMKHFKDHGVNVDDVMVEPQGGGVAQKAHALMSGASSSASSGASATPTPAPVPTPASSESSASPTPTTKGSVYSAYAVNVDAMTAASSTPATTPASSASPASSGPESSAMPASAAPRGAGVPVKSLIKFWEKFQGG